jgi:hypothetical protein
MVKILNKKGEKIWLGEVPAAMVVMVKIHSKCLLKRIYQYNLKDSQKYF